VSFIGSFLLIAALSIPMQISIARPAAAQISEVEVQGPWAYTHQFDEEHQIEFLATTRAEEMDVFLVLACSTKRVTMSFVHLNRFPYTLPARGHVTVQLGQSDPISLPVALADNNHVMADPRSTKDLVSVLIRSNRLSVSITAVGGVVHTYVFSLQPNDLALQHCH
jgi:hypothetical protein